MSQGAGAADRIVFLREVATGPMSVVYVAERRTGAIARPVVVKVLTQRVNRDVSTLVAARDRSRALATVGHHIVGTEDVVRVGDRLGLVQPWVDGLDLLDWVEILRERDVRVPRRAVCELVRSIASALEAAAHRAPPGDPAPLGLVHRDLKPSNVMIDHDGDVKVLDFGTGFTSVAGRGARAGALQKGLVKYLAPERREGKRGGHAADVYALGILAIELLRGRWLRRLHAQNPSHDRALADVVARLDELEMRTPTDELALRNLLLRMVAWDVEARPASVEVVHTFRTLADRADGPSLESFTNAHLLPWLPDFPDRPDPGVPQPPLIFLGEHEADDVVPPSVPNAREPQDQWEETDTGWRLAPIPELGDLGEEDEATDPTPPPRPRPSGLQTLPPSFVPAAAPIVEAEVAAKPAETASPTGAVARAAPVTDRAPIRGWVPVVIGAVAIAGVGTVIAAVVAWVWMT